MPTQRQLTDDELQNLEMQGIDSSTYRGKVFTIATEAEAAQMQQPAQPVARQSMSSLDAIGKTAKAHAGGYVGGGAGSIGGGLGGAALGSAIAPGPGTLVGGILGSILGGLGGGYAGQKAQEAILPDDTTARLQQEAQQASEEHPYVSGGTDIIAGALLSGGKPNLSNLPKAARGAMNAIGGKAVQAAEKEAVAKIAMNSLLNPAINTGIEYATTGELPSVGRLGADVLGGALFSETSALGRIGHPKAPKIESEAKPIPTETKPAIEEPAVSPYTMKEGDAPIIDDTAIRKAFASEFNKKPDLTGLIDTEAYKAQSDYRRKFKLPVAEMREALHDKWIEGMKADREAKKAVVDEIIPEVKHEEVAPAVEEVKPVTESKLNPEHQVNLDSQKNYVHAGETRQEETGISKLMTEKYPVETPVPKTDIGTTGDTGAAKRASTFNDIQNPPAKPVVEPNKLAMPANNTRVTDVGPEFVHVEPPEPSPAKEYLKQNEGQGEHYAPQDEYDTLKAKLTTMMRSGDVSSSEFKETWSKVETLKNEIAKGGIVGGAESLSAHIKSGKATTGSILQKIAGGNSEFAELAGHLFSTASKEKLLDKVGVGTDPLETSFYSISKSGTTISDRVAHSEHTVMHEMLHSLTSHNLLDADGIDAYDYAKTGKNPKVVEIAKTYMEAVKQLESGKEYNTDYGLKNMHEFVAMAMTNKEFQAKLNKLKSGLEDKQTLWQRLVDAIQRILGVSVKDRSLLERALKATDAIVAEERPNGKSNGTHNAPSNLPYGYWMDSSGVKHPVKTGGHEKFVKEYLEKNLTQAEKEKIHFPLSGSSEMEDIMFKKGWARLVHDHNSEGKMGLYANKDIGEMSTAQLRELKNHSIENGMVSYDASRSRFAGTGKVLHDPDSHFAPPTTVTREDKVIPIIGKATRAMIDKIRDLKNPSAAKVADAFQQVHIEKDRRIGVTQNKLQDVVEKVNLTRADEAQLEKISEYENLNHSKAPDSMFQNDKQKKVYETERAIFSEIGDNRIANKEPVYRKGIPTMLRKDEFSHPTTPNPKVVEVYRKNVDTDEMARLDKIFMENAKKYGITKESAEASLEAFKTGVQGDMKSRGSNMSFYNAARREQGIPLPAEFKRPGYLANLEAYYHRQAADNAFYKHVESKPEIMSALGEKKDAWHKDIPKDPTGGIAGNEAVRAQLGEFQGTLGNKTFRNEKALSSLITTLFISNPALDVHKAVSNLVGITNYADNPVQLGRMLGAMVKNFGSGIKHAEENGIIKMSARSVTDALQANTTMAERMQALASGIRKVSSLGVPTDKWSSGLMQAGAEAVLPMKIEKANNGDHTAQQLLKKLDPTYEKGKTYTPEGINSLASSLAGYIHGTGDGRTMPSWMSSDTELAGFFKLAHWSVSQTNRFMSDIYTPATKGNIAPLLTSLFGSAIGGYLIKEVREKIQGKQGQIPSLEEISKSDGGLKGNKSLLAYNLIAASQYAGFGGLLSQIAKYPMDFIYKNNPQGATFPLDEVANDLAETLRHASTAIANDHNLDWVELVKNVTAHMVTTNFQLGRVAYNQAIDSGLMTGTLADKKKLNDKLGQLRRFNMVEGLPYEEQDGGGNPYMNLEQKKFKTTQDPEEALKMLPELINNIMEKFKDKPDVMMQKLEALKQNSYATLPNMENVPLSFMKYMNFLGPEEGEKALRDYLQHKMINEVKSSLVP